MVVLVGSVQIKVHMVDGSSVVVSVKCAERHRCLCDFIVFACPASVGHVPCPTHSTLALLKSIHVQPVKKSGLSLMDCWLS